MAAYDLYGFEGLTLEAVRNCVQRALSIELNPHESSYHGGDYYRQGDTDSEHFILQKNRDIFDDLPIEAEFSHHSILLYVNRTDRSDAISRLLLNSCEHVSLLRHEVL